MVGIRGAGVCLVAGGEGYLGREALIGLSHEHYAVVGSCRTEKDKENLDEFIASQGLVGVKTFVADLGNEEEVVRLYQQIEAKVGPDAYLLNAAGGFSWAPAVQATEKDFNFLIESNLKSSWLLAKHGIPGMIRRKFGRIVYISTRATLGMGEPGMGLYTASKAGLNALIQSLAQEVKAYNVNVNALLPTIIDTPANRKAMLDHDHTTWVEPRTLVTLTHMMFSDAGNQLNGTLMTVPGRV